MFQRINLFIINKHLEKLCCSRGALLHIIKWPQWWSRLSGQCSPLDEGWLRRGFGGLLVRVLTQNARGMWFDSYPKLNFFSQIEMFKRINLFIIFQGVFWLKHPLEISLKSIHLSLKHKLEMLHRRDFQICKLGCFRLLGDISLFTFERECSTFPGACSTF